MERFCKYLYLQIKRVLKALPMAVLFTLLLTGILSAVFIMLSGKNQEKQEAMIVRIGVTGATDDPYFSGAMRLLEDIDTAQFSLELQMVTEAEAKDLLRAGKLTGYIIIPEGFVDSIITGENKPIKYVSTSGQAGIGTMLTRDVLSVISNLVTESQSGIYGMHTVYRKNGLQDILYEDEFDLNMRYIRYILKRGVLFEVEENGTQELSFTSYYICGIWLFLLLIWGISCSPLFSHKNQALQSLLGAKGVTVWAQIAGEYAAYLLLMEGSLLLVVMMLLTGSRIAGVSFAAFFPMRGGTWGFLWNSIPVLMVVAALQYFLYEVTDGFLNGILLQFLCAILMGYISGCFLPFKSLPESIRGISAFTPAGISMTYLTGRMAGKNEFVQVLQMAGCGLVLLLAAMCVRRYRLHNKKGQR